MKLSLYAPPWQLSPAQVLPAQMPEDRVPSLRNDPWAIALSLYGGRLAPNYVVQATHSGRMSSAEPNLSSLSKWEMVLDEEDFQMIYEKAGESARMTDPYRLLKFKNFTYG